MAERTTPADTDALVDYVLRETAGRTYDAEDGGRAFVTDVVTIVGRRCLEATERAHQLGNQVMALEQTLFELRTTTKETDRG